MALDTFVTAAAESITDLTNQANVIADKVIHADNAYKLVAEVRETNEDDATIVAFRDWFDKANAEIERRVAEVDKYIVDNGMVDTTPVDVATETENYKALQAQVKAMLGALKSMGEIGENAAKTLPELKAIPGVRKAGSNAGGGTGVKRPRLSSITVDLGDGNGPVDVFETKKGENGKADSNVANLTTLSKFLTAKFKTSVAVKDLQSDLFAAAGTDDLSTLEGKPVSFPHTLTIGEGENAKSVIVNVVAIPTVK